MKTKIDTHGLNHIAGDDGLEVVGDTKIIGKLFVNGEEIVAVKSPPTVVVETPKAQTVSKPVIQVASTGTSTETFPETWLLVVKSASKTFTVKLPKAEDGKVLEIKRHTKASGKTLFLQCQDGDVFEDGTTTKAQITPSCEYMKLVGLGTSEWLLIDNRVTVPQEKTPVTEPTVESAAK